MESPVYLTPGTVADRLGLSSSGLKRIVAIYAELYGPLPRDNADNRLWPLDVVERLEAARALVQAGKAESIKAALLAVDRGVDIPSVDLATPPSTLEVLRERLEALTALPARLDDLGARQDEAIELAYRAVTMAQDSQERAVLLQDTLLDLMAHVGGLQRKLEQLPEAVERLQEQNRVLHEEIMALAPSKEDTKAAYVEEMEEIHADLERRNRYLKGELERRDKEKAAEVRRPWWKWW